MWNVNDVVQCGGVKTLYVGGFSKKILCQNKFPHAYCFANACLKMMWFHFGLFSLCLIVFGVCCRDNLFVTH